MKLNKALYQRVFNELSKAVEALKNVDKLQNAISTSTSEAEGAFLALKKDYDAINGQYSFEETQEHDLFLSVLTNLEHLSRIEGKIKGIIYSLEEIKDDTVEPVVKAADKLN
jgi:hypothetical protein